MMVMDFIDLLSVCAEKEGKSAKRFARELFVMKDLLEYVIHTYTVCLLSCSNVIFALLVVFPNSSQIINKDIPLAHRKPYAHLLTEAFINDKMESSCDLLAMERSSMHFRNNSIKIIVKN